tara:strand:- start:60 stop:233 length:174 start_codon:yes stop_codon:yes gene_type:complete
MITNVKTNGITTPIATNNPVETPDAGADVATIDELSRAKTSIAASANSKLPPVKIIA